MKRSRPRRHGRLSLLTAALVAAYAGSAVAADQSRPFVDPSGTTARVAGQLVGQDRLDALALAAFASATWLTGGSPTEVSARTRDVVERAAREGATPVLVAYDIPLRDCSLYSAGGAADGEAYLAWIGGLASGIGKNPAIVILEPDSLGVIPWHRTLAGEPERCQPEKVDRGAAAEARFAQLRGAVDILAAHSGVRLYLDATTSSWLAPGEVASRLVRANVAKASGFFLNVSNYESDARLAHYAHWVSDCLALVTTGGLSAASCPSQFGPATMAGVATWRRIDAAYDQLFQQTGIRRSAFKQKHAVVDTSRNGQGSWTPPAGRYADAEVWCNPPARGVGRRPTFATGDGYIDAFLWIKTPGQSDGQCHRGAKGPLDPERGVVDPPAGQWFAGQARELIAHASPALPSR